VHAARAAAARMIGNAFMVLPPSHVTDWLKS
jgi:hypothetical protein